MHNAREAPQEGRERDKRRRKRKEGRI